MPALVLSISLQAPWSAIAAAGRTHCFLLLGLFRAGAGKRRLPERKRGVSKRPVPGDNIFLAEAEETPSMVALLLPRCYWQGGVMAIPFYFVLDGRDHNPAMFEALGRFSAGNGRAIVATRGRDRCVAKFDVASARGL